MVGMVFFLISVANYAVWRHVLIPGMSDVNILTELGYGMVSLAYGLCVAMLVWCYLRTVLDSPGEVPPAWYPFHDESQRQYLQHDDGYRKSVLEGYEQALEQATPTDESKFQLAYMYATRPRWCKKCRVRPLRIVYIRSIPCRLIMVIMCAEVEAPSVASLLHEE